MTTLDRWPPVGTVNPMDAIECLNKSPECEGPVEFRPALSATGVSYPRCEFHWEIRLKEQERIRREYPDSPSPPSWFDPAAAGERWDDD